MHTLDLSGYSITSSLACVFAALASHPGRRYWLKDTDGTYLHVSDLFASDLGRTVAQVVGRSTAELWPACCGEIERVDSLVCQHRRDYSQHMEALAFPTGEVRDIEVSRSPVVGCDGAFVGVAGYYDGPDWTGIEIERERQLVFRELSAEGLGRVADGLRALREELSA